MLQDTRVIYSTYAISAVAILASGFLLFQNHQQSQQIEQLFSYQDYLQSDKLSLETELSEASTTIDMLTEELLSLNVDLEDLENDYRDEQSRNEEFEDQIRSVSKTVGVLDKLSKTDKELLQKYSKVYFLNEHYIPESIKTIDNEWKYNEQKDLRLHSKVIPYFNDMVEAAKDDGVELWVVSAYRSYGEQAALKGSYVVTYGSGANAFSADQGYSEHQLGTTIDFTTRGLSGGLDGFENTPAYEWLTNNAHKYGFTLSYSEGNGYYVFEPWHWRFVGEDLAKDLNRANAHFYDWEQRKIDGYLISIFD